MQPSFVRIALASCALASLPAHTLAETKYWVRVTPQVTGKFTVEVSVQTNLPDAPVLAATLGLHGQKDEDSFVGTDLVRVEIRNRKGRAVIDGERNHSPGLPLPKAQYDVDVGFYPTWDENAAVAAATGIKQVGIEAPVQGRGSVTIDGSGGVGSLRHGASENADLGNEACHV
jgi:hypothetical protein